MPAKSPRSGHVLTREQNAKGGRNGKPGPSVKTKWLKILNGNLPKEVRDALENNSFIDRNGNLKLMPIKTFSKDALESFAMVGIYRALKDSDVLYKLITETIDGKAKQSVELTGNIDHANADETVKKFIEKHGLAERT